MSNNSMTKIFDKVKFFDKVKIVAGGVFNAPTYNLQRSVNAVSGGGSSITFTVNTTNVENGTSLPYTISNISPSDVTSGSLTGTFTVANNTASTTLGVSLEPTSPGIESASLALDNGAASISIFPAPTYSLSRSSASVNEGSSITFTLTTTGVADGTSVPYTISGISAGDLSSGSLTGNFVISEGSATVTLTAANDSLTDEVETISITAGGQTSNVTLNDTSLFGPPLYLAGEFNSENNSYPVTLFGSPTISSMAVVGNQSMSFPGGNNYLQYNQTAGNVGDVNNNSTIELWIRPSAYGGQLVALQNFSTYQMNWQLLLLGDGTLSLNWWEGVGATVNSTTAVPLDTWTKVAVTWKQSNLTANIFINGSLVGTGPKNNVQSGYPGNYINVGWQYSGLIDDLKITPGQVLY